jgi:hypothetical protein
MRKPYRFHLALNQKMADRNKMILALKEMGGSNVNIAKAMNVSPSVVGRVVYSGSFATTPI